MMALPGLPVSVDDSRESLGLSTYLLTHMHTDHLKGLRDGWKGGTIYCTRVTRELLLTRFDISPSRVVPLDVDDVGHVLKAQDPCTGCDIWFNLTVIDANHCPGSAMFLLKSEPSGCILHTGDFRACPEMLASAPLKDAKVDLLIMDNTYCHPKHALPSQSEALESIIEIAARHSKTHRILIGLDGLGKEEVLVALAEALHTHVSITPKRMQSIKTCGFPTDRFVCDESWDGWMVRLVERRKLTRASLQAHHEVKPTIGIIASGWGLNASKDEGLDGGAALYRVPYSLHSSFSELEAFVAAVRPRCLWGTALPSNEGPLENDVMEHFSHLLSSPAYVPPPSASRNRVRGDSGSPRPVAYVPPPSASCNRVRGDSGSPRPVAYVPPPSASLQQPAVSRQGGSGTGRAAVQREGSRDGGIAACGGGYGHDGDDDGDDDDDDDHDDECGDIGKGAEPLLNQPSSRPSAQQQPNVGADYGGDTAQGQNRGCASGGGSGQGGTGNGRKAGVWRVGGKHRPRRAVVSPLRNDDDDDHDDDDIDHDDGGGDGDGDGDGRGGVFGGGSKSSGVRTAPEGRVAVEAIAIPNDWLVGAETGGGGKGAAAAKGRQEEGGDCGGGEATLAWSGQLSSAAGKRRLPSFVGARRCAGRGKRPRDAAGPVISSKIAPGISVLSRMKPGPLACTEAVVHSESEVVHSQGGGLHSRVAVLLPSKGANISKQGGGRGAFGGPCKGGKGKKFGVKGDGAKDAKRAKEEREKEVGVGEIAGSEGADDAGYGGEDERGGQAATLSAVLLAPKVGGLGGGGDEPSVRRKLQKSAKKVGGMQGTEGGGKVGRGSAFGSMKKQARRRC